MWLIPKGAGKQNIERLRPLWFESEILKLQEHIMEGRVDALCLISWRWPVSVPWLRGDSVLDSVVGWLEWGTQYRAIPRTAP